MNESTTALTKQFTGCATLAAIGIKLRERKVFEAIKQTVQIEQKTIKDSPTDKLYDALISLLAGAHGLVEINTRLRADAALQRAFGRSRCAEQSVVQDTLNACTAQNGSSALLMKLACLSLPRIRCQKCPTIHFTYSSIE